MWWIWSPKPKDPGVSQVVLWWRIHLLIQETQEMRVGFLGQEDPLEKEMTTHSSILALKIPWTEEPGGLQHKGLQRGRHNWATEKPEDAQMEYNRLFLSLYIKLEGNKMSVKDVWKITRCNLRVEGKCWQTGNGKKRWMGHRDKMSLHGGLF